MSKKILWLSDSPFTTTGFATVTWNVLNELSKDYDCHCLAHNYVGQVVKPPIVFEDDTMLKFKMHGCGRAKYSMDAIKPIIDKYNINIFGGLLDTFMVAEAGFLNIDTSPCKTFFYFPSDGGGRLPLNCENVLRKVNMPIAMSKFAQIQAKKVHGIDTEYIPHGVDTKNFYPLTSEEKKKLRNKFSAKFGFNFNNKFVIGWVGRNQPRKMMDRAIKAFAEFAKGKDNVVFLLHADPNDPAGHFNIPQLIQDLGVENKIVWTDATFFKPYTYAEMNEVYNMMDVFFLSTSGEGFGVPTIEAMACGVPQIVSDYTTTYELVSENGCTGERIKLAGDDFGPQVHTNEILDGSLTGSWNVERGLMSIAHAVETLNKLYKNPDILAEYSKNCVPKVKKYYDWKVIMPMWKKAFKKLMEE